MKNIRVEATHHEDDSPTIWIVNDREGIDFRATGDTFSEAKKNLIKQIKEDLKANQELVKISSSLLTAAKKIKV